VIAPCRTRVLRKLGQEKILASFGERFPAQVSEWSAMLCEPRPWRRPVHGVPARIVLRVVAWPSFHARDFTVPARFDKLFTTTHATRTTD
jgi:hypothetical protein